MDFEPREGMSMICQSLPNLAEMVSREVQAEEQMNSGEALLNRAIDTYWDSCIYLDTRNGLWRIKYVNDAFVALTGTRSYHNMSHHIINFYSILDPGVQGWSL